MKQTFNLREFKKNDWKVLLEWRNDKITRQNSFNSDVISISEHKEFIDNTVNNPTRTIFILEYNEIPVGTIKEDRLNKDEFKLSYTISPMHRGKRIGQTMISLYLIERKGAFLCEIKEDNFSSIKMIRKLGFQFIKTKNRVHFYKLIKN
jgi:RimJ/RimL family protein N-acetyltransferase